SANALRGGAPLGGRGKLVPQEATPTRATARAKPKERGARTRGARCTTYSAPPLPLFLRSDRSRNAPCTRKGPAGPGVPPELRGSDDAFAPAPTPQACTPIRTRRRTRSGARSPLLRRMRLDPVR